MNADITPAEAWEEVERLKVCVSYHRDKCYWSATAFKPVVTVGCGPTPTDAVADLLGWLAKSQMQRPGIQNGLKKLEIYD